MPRDLRLNPFTLAVWYMDDGSKSNNSCYLNTQKFSLSDQRYLIWVFKRRFGLKPHLDRDKQYRRLRFSVSDTKKFKQIVKRFVLPSLQYKFPV